MLVLRCATYIFIGVSHGRPLSQGLRDEIKCRVSVDLSRPFLLHCEASCHNPQRLSTGMCLCVGFSVGRAA